MRRTARAVAAALVALTLGVGVFAIGEAQPPLRIGASLAQTGPYAVPAQNQLRGYRLCVKHANEKGGVLGRRIELIVEDDQSKASTAVAIYERLITQDKVDAILGPYYAPVVEAVTELSEKHKMPMVSPAGATTSIHRKGRRFVFMMFSPGEVYLEGLIDMAAKRGLKTVALIYEDTLFPRGLAQGTLELARKRGLSVVLLEAYPPRTTDFSTVLARVRTANPDVLAAGTYFEDAVTITRQLREVNVNPKMFAVTVGGDFPQFSQMLGAGRGVRVRVLAMGSGAGDAPRRRLDPRRAPVSRRP